MRIDWEKILKAIKKTGDRCLVIDQSAEKVFVIIDFSDYEQLIGSRGEIKGLTEGQLLDKINQDIALWQSSQVNTTENWSEEIKSKREIKEKNIEDERYYVEPVE